MASQLQRRKRRLERVQATAAPASITFEPVSVVIVASGADALPTFEAVAYSGGKLYVKGFDRPVVVDLDGIEINANATILLDHDSTKRVGHPDSISITKGEIRVSGVISAQSDHANEVVASARNKFRWQMSIGARVQAAYEVPAGKSVTVNGKVHQGPLIVASKSKLNEISFVGSGGDEDNVVKIAASAVHEDTEMKIGELIKKAIAAMGLSVLNAAAKLGVTESELQDVIDGKETEPSGRFLSAASKELGLDMTELKRLSGRTAGATQPKYETTNHIGDPSLALAAGAAGNETADLVKSLRDAAAAETKRIADIHAVFGGKHTTIEAQAISDGWDVVKAELEFMRADRDAEATVNASAGGTGIALHTKGRHSLDRDGQGRAIEASLCMQLGMAEDNVKKHHDDKVMELALSREFRGITLKAMMDRSLRSVGQHLGHGQIDGDTIQAFFHAEQQLQASAPGTFSTMAATGILANVANKLLLDAFTQVGTTVPILFGRRSVKDFKTNTSYRLGVNGDLDEVGPGGEIKHADLDNTSFTFGAKTFGRMLTLTRRDIINDDLSAFNQIPQQLGYKAATKLEKEGWALILSNPGTFFGSGNANNQSGATTALSIDSLTAAETLFFNMKDASGTPIMLRARYLVTGTAIATVAAELMKETRIIMEQRITTSTTKNAIPASNPHAGKWEPIMSPFVNNAGLTGSSATVWYLFADPAQEAAFVVSYLNGRDTPMIESSDLDFNHLGMSWRVVFDFGVDDHEPKAAVRSVGA